MLVELLAVILLASGIATRHIPYFNLYTSLINNTPLSITNKDTSAIYLLLFQHHFIHNILIWLLVFGSAQFILYYLRTLSSNKLNKKYPSNQLIFKECARSIRGVLIGTTIQVVVERLYVTKHLPLVSSKLSLYLEQSIHTQSSSFDITCCLLLGALIMVVIGETHFYFTHRLLHTTWLYQNVHKQHHESINPDPMSGLSMHWIESTIYFSTPFFIGLVSPLWLARLMTKALLITPIQGHSGFTTTIKGNAINDMVMNAGIDHYIHHAKFRYNFGANPFWDRLFGTEYPQDKKELLMNQFYASNKKDDAKDIVHSSGKKSNSSILKSIVTYQFLLFGLFEFVSAVNWWNNSTKERKASNGLLPQESTTEVFVVGWCVYLVTLGLVRLGVPTKFKYVGRVLFDTCARNVVLVVLGYEKGICRV